MRAPALVLAIPLVAGVAGGAYLTPGALFPSAVSIAAVLGAAAAVVRRRAAGVAWAVAIGSAAAGVLIGARAQREADAPSLLARTSVNADAPVHLAGVLREDAAVGAQAVTATVDAVRVSASGESAAVAGGVRLAVLGVLARARSDEWRGGRAIDVHVTLRLPLDYRDPGVPSDRERLARQGIALLGTVKSAALVTVTRRGSPLAEAAAALRAFVRRAVAAGVGRWSPRSAGVVTAILIGDRSGLEPADERRLQDAGTYHVIAISGGNIALLTMLLIVAGRFTGLAPRATAAAAIALLLFYGYAAGLAPSVLRATLAGVLYLAGRALDRHGPALNALAVAAAWAAAAAPLTVVDPGFILSFGATLGIVVAASRLMPARRREHDASRARRVVVWLRRGAWELGAATICAELALAPVGARLFGRISVAGLALNFIAIPLMSLIQVAGMATVAMAPISTLVAAGIGWIAHVSTVALIWSAGLVDVAPWLVLDVPPPAWWVVLAWYAGCASMLLARRRLRLVTAGMTVAAGLLVVIGPPFARSTTVVPAPPGWSRIVFADVGQGDAAFVWPAGADPFMVDAGGVPGGAFDVGRRVTLPVAWALRLRRVSSLVLSHGDPDHIGGAGAVMRALAPREVLEGIPVPSHVPLQQVRAQAEAERIPWRPLRAGDTFDAGVAHVRVLNPPEPDWERPKVRNDDSVVLDVRIGDVSLILPGDIGAAAEEAVIPLLAAAPLTIVKAPHHGSGGSSSAPFIAALHPAAVIFSAGRRNAFGHPAPAVVDRYRASGAEVFRTDQDGAVFLETDGHEVVIWSWARRHRFAVSAGSRPHHEDLEGSKTSKRDSERRRH